jgi:hypothetical protein
MKGLYAPPVLASRDLRPPIRPLPSVRSSPFNGSGNRLSEAKTKQEGPANMPAPSEAIFKTAIWPESFSRTASTDAQSSIRGTVWAASCGHISCALAPFQSVLSAILQTARAGKEKGQRQNRWPCLLGRMFKFRYGTGGRPSPADPRSMIASGSQAKRGGRRGFAHGRLRRT